jgi:hypothetical protein
MRLSGVRAGDLVRVNRLGRIFVAEVTATTRGGLDILPCDKRITYRTCRAREVIEHWPKRTRRTTTDCEQEPSPRQLALNTADSIRPTGRQGGNLRPR